MLLANEKIQPSAYALGLWQATLFWQVSFQMCLQVIITICSMATSKMPKSFGIFARSSPEVAELKAIIKWRKQNREFKSSLRNPINEEPVVRNGKTLTKEIKKSLRKLRLKRLQPSWTPREEPYWLVSVGLNWESSMINLKTVTNINCTWRTSSNRIWDQSQLQPLKSKSFHWTQRISVGLRKIKTVAWWWIYVRTGPSTTLLSEDQIPRHIQNRIWSCQIFASKRFESEGIGLFEWFSPSGNYGRPINSWTTIPALQRSRLGSGWSKVSENLAPWICC